MPNYFKNRGIRKILLIRPPLSIDYSESKSLTCPLGLAYLAAVLEKDYEVRILDCPAEGFDKEIRDSRTITYGLSPDEIKKRIKIFFPDVVGISCLFSTQHLSSINICSIVKDIDSGIITILGGAHPSSCQEKVLNNDAVDFVLIGEAEEGIVKLLDAISKDGNFFSIDGLGYKEDGRIVVNPKLKYIQGIDKIPFPARHLLPMEIYFRINRPHGMQNRFSPNTNMITSRGCPGGCVFCSIHTIFGRDYRVRSAENVLQEMELLKKEYGIKEIQFEDDNLTLDKLRAADVFEGMVKNNLDIAWTAPNGVALWALDYELIELMKKSGCWHLALGIESGDEEVLDRIIRKPLRLNKISPLVKRMSELNIRTTSFFVVGFPGENKTQIKNTFKFALSLPTDDINIFFATPYPGTELCRISEEKNLLDSNSKFNNLRVTNVNILPQDISVKQLRKLAARTILLFRFKRFLRNPQKFILIWIKRFLKEPPQALRKFIALLKTSLFPAKG